MAEAPEVVGIDVLLRRTRAPPASNFASLVAFRAEVRKGDGGGRPGLLIGVARGRNGWAFTGIEEEKLQGARLLAWLKRGRRRPG
jgi:hypothetical protein